MKLLLSVSLFFTMYAQGQEVDASRSALLQDKNEDVYEKLKDAYGDRNTVVPTFDDFYRIGESDTRNCIEATKDNPTEDRFVGIYLFVKHQGDRGGLLGSATRKKVIVHNQPNIFNMFDNQVSNSFSSRSLISEFDGGERNEYKTEIKKLDNYLVFKRRGVLNGERFQSYGYCYDFE